MDTHGDSKMLTHINLHTKSKSGILPQEGNANTFHKEKSRQEILVPYQ